MRHPRVRIAQNIVAQIFLENALTPKARNSKRSLMAIHILNAWCQQSAVPAAASRSALHGGGFPQIVATAAVLGDRSEITPFARKPL